MHLYDISQNARKIYQKASIDKKRMLLNFVFGELLIDDGKVVYKYTEPVETLASAVKATNSSKVADLAEFQFTTFEPSKNGLTKAKNRAFCPVHPDWLGAWDRFRTFEWVKSIESPKLILEQTKELLSLIKPKGNLAEAA